MHAGRITALRERHAQLSEQIERLERSPASDTTVISDLKKQKLAIKDEMTALSAAD